MNTKPSNRYLYQPQSVNNASVVHCHSRQPEISSHVDLPMNLDPHQVSCSQRGRFLTGFSEANITNMPTHHTTNPVSQATKPSPKILNMRSSIRLIGQEGVCRSSSRLPSGTGPCNLHYKPQTILTHFESLVLMPIRAGSGRSSLDRNKLLSPPS